MTRGIFKKLALGASCAVLLTGLATGQGLAQETQIPPTAENPTPPAQSGSDSMSVLPSEVPGGNDTTPMQVAATPQQRWTLMTLPQAVGVSVNSYPEHGIVANNRRATDEELQQAKGLWLPQVDVRADGGYERADNVETRNDFPGFRENAWRYEAGITLTQMLFDGFAAKYENLRQKARVLSAAHRVREAAELQALAAVESYLEVMRQRELLQIARDNVAQHQAILNQIQDSTRAGKTTNADLEQSNARLTAARAEEADTRQSLRNAESDFIRDIGQQPEDLVMPQTPAEHLDADIEQEVKTSLAQSPTLAIYQSDINVAHQEYNATQSSLYPRLDLQLQGEDGKNLGGVEGRNNDDTALVVMNWNLYRGGADMARRREYINREAQAKEERAKAARDLEDDIRHTWANMQSSGERAKAFSDQAAANGNIVKAYIDQFSLNRRTLLDVLDSQNEWFVSRANAVNAEYLQMFAVYRLLALKGELMKTLNVPVPREAEVENK